jgi:hypothetical protein
MLVLPCLPLLALCLPQSLNRRDATVFDLYSLDAQTLKLTLHTVNPGDVTNWLFDYNFNVRVSRT